LRFGTDPVLFAIDDESCLHFVPCSFTTRSIVNINQNLTYNLIAVSRATFLALFLLQLDDQQLLQYQYEFEYEFEPKSYDINNDEQVY